MNCGCSRNDHKISGASQVDIPYLSHLKFGNKTTNESSSPLLSQLEWYPPDLTDEQVLYIHTVTWLNVTVSFNWNLYLPG